MKRYFWGLISLCVLGLLGYFIVQNPHTELVIILKPWEIHASVWFVLFGLAWIGLLWGLLMKGLRYISGWHQAWLNWQRGKKQQAQQKHNTQGLIAYLEGRFGEAQLLLSQTANQQSLPALNYLLAAQSAHAVGDSNTRDQLLQKAELALPEAEYGLSYLQADYHLQDGRSELSLPILEAMHENKPHDLRVVKMLISLYEHSAQGEKLLNLLSGKATPNLRKELGDRLVNDLEDKAAHWLSLQHQQDDPKTLQKCVSLLPKRLRKNNRWLALHFPGIPASKCLSLFQ